MGSCASKRELKLAAVNISRQIDQELQLDAEAQDTTIKLLLLGPGECGKSTVLKQMKIMHHSGFTIDELCQQRAAILSNTLHMMATLLYAMQDMDIPLDGVEKELDALTILNVIRSDLADEPYTKDVQQALQSLWTDSGVQEAYERRAEFQLSDSAKYFLDSVDRLSSADYLPTERDVLMCRVKTTGVVEISFVIKDTRFRVFDVGGQRTDRRKWIHCFDDVQCVLYVAAINEYDQVLYEDCKTNRLRESINLFDSVVNSVWFTKTDIILFLNKTDLFSAKITRVPLTVVFPEYQGDQSFSRASSYIQGKFVRRNQNQLKMIYTHLTCATDTDQVQLVLDNVTDMLVQENIRGVGLT